MYNMSYSRFPLHGHSLSPGQLRTVSLVPTKSGYIFPNLTRLKGNTNNGHFSVSPGHKLSYMINSASRNLVIWTLFVYFRVGLGR